MRCCTCEEQIAQNLGSPRSISVPDIDPADVLVGVCLGTLERRVFHADRDIRIDGRFDLGVPFMSVVAAHPLGGKIVIDDRRGDSR